VAAIAKLPSPTLDVYEKQLDVSVETTPELAIRQDELAWLEVRLGPEHARRRAHLELAAEAKGARREAKTELSFWPLADKFAPRVLRATGMLARGQANAARIQVTRNSVEIPGLPKAFDGYTLLHITDLHADISLSAMRCHVAVWTGLLHSRCKLKGRPGFKPLLVLMKPAAVGKFHDGLTTTEPRSQIEQHFSSLISMGSDILHRE
jgi:hypothetical protein